MEPFSDEYEQWLEAAAEPTRDHGTSMVLGLLALAVVVAMVVL